MKKSAELIAKNLSKVRAEQGLSVLMLSEMTNICKNRLKQIESMRAEGIAISELDALSEALDIDTWELLRDG